MPGERRLAESMQHSQQQICLSVQRSPGKGNKHKASYKGSLLPTDPSDMSGCAKWAAMSGCNMSFPSSWYCSRLATTSSSCVLLNQDWNTCQRISVQYSCEMAGFNNGGGYALTIMEIRKRRVWQNRDWLHTGCHFSSVCKAYPHPFCSSLRILKTYSHSPWLDAAIAQ